MNKEFSNDDIEIVMIVDSISYTRTQLKDAFDAVLEKNMLRTNIGTAWKAPIQAIIPASSQEVTRVAIAFYVGEYPSITPSSNPNDHEVLIESRGYYQVIGA